MIQHYLKVAFRNLLKYKLQSVISIVGLAVGFACFALSALWIRYEMAYDTFHDGAERIFLVRCEDKTGSAGLSNITPWPLASYLQETFPEVEKACNTGYWKNDVFLGDEAFGARHLRVDSAFINMFRITIVKGNTGFLADESKYVALTEEFAKKIFGNEDPLGKKLKVIGEEMSVCAIVKGWPQHSNLVFDILVSNYKLSYWAASGWDTYIKVREDTDIKAFDRKVYEHKIEKDRSNLSNIVLTSLTSVRYNQPNIPVKIKFSHIVLFAIAGGLVILCSLFNYLTLFISRVYMRMKELGLRLSCGSSEGKLLSLLAVEYVMTLLFAVLLGMILIETVLPFFKGLSEITETSGLILKEASLYAGGVATISFLLSLIPIYYFRNKTIHSTIKGSGKGNNLFQKALIVFQLMIGVGFIFCTIIMIKQIHFLTHTDRVIQRAERGVVMVYTSEETVREELKQIPYIDKVIDTGFTSLLPSVGRTFWTLPDWDDKPENVDKITLETLYGGESLCSYYGLHLLKGTMLRDDEKGEKIMINETAARRFGWDNPIGKTILMGDSIRKEVIGVIRDFCRESPTVPMMPIAFVIPSNHVNFNEIPFIYKKGHWKECKQQIEALIKEKHPEIFYSSVSNMKETFDKFIESENALIKLLDFVSVVCVIISVFGVFSLVTLHCEQSRKGIAIRKVNGADSGTIIKMFLGKYLLLLCIASAIIFPTGYLVMKRWLENYVLQTTTGSWIYLVIFVGMALIITGSIFRKVKQAASQNPAEVIKTE